MTKKKAKEILQEQIDRYGQEYDAEGIEALKVAIEVLEQESQIEDINIRRMLIEANVNGYAEGRKDVLDKVRAEIKEWYWQADKQALAKDPCVVDDMVDLFIRTIKKYKAESEIVEMNLDDSIKNVKSECYVSPSLNMDRAIMVNTSLDMLISKVDKTKELLTRYDTRSATKCYEIVQMLKEEYEV